MVKHFIILCCVLLSALCVQGYSVTGNQLYGPDGKAILLRGVCRPSFEWNAAGQYISQSDFQLMKNWGFNVVRLSLNQDFWLSGSSTYNSAYQSNVDTAVSQIKALGLGVILDLHWSDKGSLTNGGGQQIMADANSVTFWTQVATKYKNDAWILFELYNEPHDVSWDIWRNGGSSGGFTISGMQQLYNAVRGTGANNVVIINGLNWAYDLSGVPSYAVTGTNIMYGTHPYDNAGKQSADWPTGFGNLAATYPVIMTEFGQYCATNTYVKDVLAYAASKKIHWTAWAWWVQDCNFPSIIADWSGNTLGNTGTWVKAAIASSTTAIVATTAATTTTTTTGTTKAATTTTTGTTKAATTTTTSTTKSATTTTTSTTKAATTTTTGSTTGSTTGQVIFDEAYKNSWVSYSWGTYATVSTPTHAGSAALSLTLNNYDALYFHHTAFAINTYTSLVFWIRGGQSASQPITVRVYDNSASPVVVGNAVSLPTAIVYNSWVKETIPLTSFGLATSTQITGFAIQANLAGTAGIVYVDDVALA